MRSLQRFALVAVAAVLTSGAGILFGLTGTPDVTAIAEFSGLALAALLLSAFAILPSADGLGATMPPSFVFTFAILLRFGGDAAAVVALACAATSACVQWQLAHPIHKVIANVATVIATLVAALVYQTL